MSLILEALRKSETERRRAQAPDLFAEPTLVARHDPAASPRWLIWALAVLAALALTGWFARGLWNAPLPPAAAKPASTRVDDMPQRPSPARGATPSPQANANIPVRVAITPAPVPAVASVAVAGSAQVAQTRPVPTPTVADLPQRTVESLPESISATVPAPEANPAPALANASPTGAPLRLSDLSSDERRELPTLKMSMHLWHAESSQRFVIVDGERMGEGDRIGDAVIEEITRDGVLLGWQGRRLKLPIQ